MALVARATATVARRGAGDHDNRVFYVITIITITIVTIVTIITNSNDDY